MHDVSTPAAGYARRNPAIDRLRALTMVLMVFVNEFWAVRDVPHWMAHAAVGEDFMGLSDYIFGLFLFVMGMSIPYAVESRYRKGSDGARTLGHLLRRTLALLVMGVFTVNIGPGLPLSGGHGQELYLILMTVGIFLVWTDYPSARWARWLQLAGGMLLAGMALVYRTPDGHVFEAQWWGILGLIGWAYLFCAVLYLLVRDRPGILLAVLGILAVVNIIGTPTRSGALLVPRVEPNAYDSFLDVLQLRNAGHQMLALGGMILSVVSVRFAARWRWPRRLGVAAAASALIGVLGAVAHHWFIASKNGAYLPWVLWVSAVAVLLYALYHALPDPVGAPGLRGALLEGRLLRPAGTATLTMYMVPYIYMGVAGWTGWNLWGHFSGAAGILYCALYTVLILLITWGLTRLHVRLKV